MLGLSQAVSWAGIPVGGLLAGWAVQGLRLPAAGLLFGLPYLVVTLVPFFGRDWRELDRRPHPDPTGPDRPDPTDPGHAGTADDRPREAASVNDSHEHLEQDQGERCDREDDQQVTAAPVAARQRGGLDG